MGCILVKRVHCSESVTMQTMNRLQVKPPRAYCANTSICAPNNLERRWMFLVGKSWIACTRSASIAANRPWAGGSSSIHAASRLLLFLLRSIPSRRLFMFLPAPRPLHPVLFTPFSSHPSSFVLFTPPLHPSFLPLFTPGCTSECEDNYSVPRRAIPYCNRSSLNKKLVKTMTSLLVI